jgi:hypothetical protein
MVLTQSQTPTKVSVLKGASKEQTIKDSLHKEELSACTA